MSNSSPVSKALCELHRNLGISEDFLAQCSMPFCQEADVLEDTEADFYGRPQQLTPVAKQAWQEMKSAAAQQGVVIHLISAFRGFEYQYQLLKRKLDAGEALNEILTVNAAPGYSEHHTGRAIDIGTIDSPALEVEFENTPAFDWLCANAADFGFSMSYPRNNPLGIDYEPWHWCYQERA